VGQAHGACGQRQWLANIGKTESGVVSVSSLWADEKIYWAVNFEPYTPAHHFERGKEDPKFRTKLKIASRLVEQALPEGIPFRAVVADSFYGEDEGFKQSLSELGVGYVMALKPSRAWWHRVGEIGSPYEAAVVTPAKLGRVSAILVIGLRLYEVSRTATRRRGGLWR
jgi:SRSO17 transposase